MGMRRRGGYTMTNDIERGKRSGAGPTGKLQDLRRTGKQRE